MLDLLLANADLDLAVFLIREKKLVIGDTILEAWVNVKQGHALNYDTHFGSGVAITVELTNIDDFVLLELVSGGHDYLLDL